MWTTDKLDGRGNWDQLRNGIYGMVQGHLEGPAYLEHAKRIKGGFWPGLLVLRTAWSHQGILQDRSKGLCRAAETGIWSMVRTAGDKCFAVMGLGDNIYWQLLWTTLDMLVWTRGHAEQILCLWQCWGGMTDFIGRVEVQCASQPHTYCMCSGSAKTLRVKPHRYGWHLYSSVFNQSIHQADLLYHYSSTFRVCKVLNSNEDPLLEFYNI